MALHALQQRGLLAEDVAARRGEDLEPQAATAAERVVTEVSVDAAGAFTDLEEDFFRAGIERPAKGPGVSSESFDDLDEGYQPVGFWDRLLGRKPKR